MPTTVDAMVELPYLEEWWDGPFDVRTRTLQPNSDGLKNSLKCALTTATFSIWHVSLRRTHQCALRVWLWAALAKSRKCSALIISGWSNSRPPKARFRLGRYVGAGICHQGLRDGPPG